VFAYRRTPYLGVVYGALIGSATTWLLETPEAPLTFAQAAIFYALSCLPGLGLAMLGDPASRKAKAEFLQVDFYAPKELGDPVE
jgi:hypothetical protein